MSYGAVRVRHSSATRPLVPAWVLRDEDLVHLLRQFHRHLVHLALLGGLDVRVAARLLVQHRLELLALPLQLGVEVLAPRRAHRADALLALAHEPPELSGGEVAAAVRVERHPHRAHRLLAEGVGVELEVGAHLGG